MGVPQLSLKYVVDGGRNVTNVVGAVPVMVVLGDVVAVPPEIASVDPAPEPPGSFHSVSMINCVPDPAVLALTRMLCPV